MKKHQDGRIILGLAALYLVVAAAILGWQGMQQLPNLGASLLQGEFPRTMTGVLIGSGTIVHVRDGDTVEVRLEGADVPVRLIGVDTPESVHPAQPVECYGREASAFTRQFERMSAVLYEDPTQDSFDTYGRRLAYVVLQDGRQLNALLVEQGIGREYTYQQSRYLEQDRFRSLETQAKEAGRGLWKACK